ncbi:MAG: orotidine-5'-phosphate decarboxylase [Acidobacteriota bacterium]|jgi:orotidine-5'-phosphate decarboxylase|nr:orotidine-5'-phosphate decarboxylase [Acidobacteriota bacterium]
MDKTPKDAPDGKDAKSRLIVALDVPDRATALEKVDLLSGRVGCFKLGLEIFSAEGPRLVEEIRDRGEDIFLDLKLHDIPNTVAGAVRSACKLGVKMLTVHASGGAAMLRAAVDAAQEAAAQPLILAVTALTSLSEDDVARLGVGQGVEQWVETLASIAHGAGVRGLVASSKELPALRRRFDDGMELVIPGIRPAGAATQDQSRTATPGAAILAGADFIVVGRPILNADDPGAAADAIVAEVRQAL